MTIRTSMTPNGVIGSRGVKGHLKGIFNDTYFGIFGLKKAQKANINWHPPELRQNLIKLAYFLKK